MLNHKTEFVLVEVDVFIVHFDSHFEEESAGLHWSFYYFAALDQFNFTYNAPHFEGRAIKLVKKSQLLLC